MTFRPVLVLVLAAALALAAAASDPAPLPVHVGGRVVREGGGAMRFGWPATYFEARFEGTGVSAAVDTRDDFFRLYVDGAARADLGPDKPSARIEGLAPGAHEVRLEKLTENQGGSSRFLGFRLIGPGRALAAPAAAHRIEFIGDSHSAGYGDTAPGRECTRKAVHDTTDTQQAFGPLVAKRLGWDYRVNAYSGFGIVRNYDGGVPGDSMVKRYPRAIPGEPGAAPGDGWKPDWIVIDLGSNDFSTPLHAGEAWPDAAALHADYRATYAEFVRMLRARHPQARILLVRYRLFDADVAAVAAAVGDPKVTTIAVEPHELTGCDWHPSLADHRAMADAIVARIAAAK